MNNEGLTNFVFKFRSNFEKIVKRKLKLIITLVILIIVIFTPIWVGIILITLLLCYYLFISYKYARVGNVKYIDLDSLFKSTTYYVGQFLLGVLMFLYSVFAIVFPWSSISKASNSIFDNMFDFILLIVGMPLFTSLALIIGYFGIKNIVLAYIIMPIAIAYEKYEFAIYITPSISDILELNKKEGIDEDYIIVQHKSYGYRIIDDKKEEWFLSVKESIDIYLKLQNSILWNNKIDRLK